MERQLDQLRILLPLLHEIEQMLPRGAIPIDLPYDGAGPGLIHNMPPRVKRMRLSGVALNKGLMLAVGIVERAYDSRDGTATEAPPPGIIIGTADNEMSYYGAVDLALPIFPDRGFAFGTVSPEDPCDLRVQFCWGPTDNRDVNHRGHMFGTPTPLSLRQAFDLPGSFPAMDQAPERRMHAEAFVEACRTLIRATCGA